jgi:hypothetical protein
MSNLIERLKHLEARTYAADTQDADKRWAEFQDELAEAWPKLLAVVEAAEEMDSIDNVGAFFKMKDALAALEDK